MLTPHLCLHAGTRTLGADEGSAPSLEATYGAAHLANSCVSLLMAAVSHGAGGGRAELVDDVMWQVQDLVDVTLSVGEWQGGEREGVVRGRA